MNTFEERLKGGHPNSLGNTIDIVDEVLHQNALFDELFECYFSGDEIVRLRTSNAMKRICKEKKTILLPYIDRLIIEVAEIDQASTQWTLAQLFAMLESDLSEQQKAAAREIMKHNLANHRDWIVLTQSMDTLTKWALNEVKLRAWMMPHLERLSSDKRKSVAGKAKKMLDKLL